MRELIQLSRSLGCRWDYVQAGGGNTAIKTKDTEMWIKASGCALADVGEADTLSCVNPQSILNHLQTKTATTQTLQQTQKPGTPRPSLETWLHAACSEPVTLHTHPLALMLLLQQPDWKSKLHRLYGFGAHIPWLQPGPKLAEAVLKNPNQNAVWFLQNHGIFLGAPTVAEALKKHAEIVQIAAQKLGLDVSLYENSEQIYKALVATNSWQGTILPVTDFAICEALSKTPEVLQSPWCSADVQVYCGFEILQTRPLTLIEDIQRYMERFREHPKVFYFQGNLFVAAVNQKQAQYGADVLKFQILASCAAHGQTQGIPLSERQKLVEWEAEEYRRKQS